MILAALLAFAAAPGDDVAATARAREEAAFAAVGEKRWCAALNLFLEADRLEPSPDLVFNAAQAAELGADRARAMQLYTQLLGTTTSAARKAEAKSRIAVLTKLVEKSGPGAACPAAELDAAADAPAAVTTTGTAGTAASPVAPAEASTSTPPAPGTPWPWVTAGVGGVAFVAGAVLAVVGMQPWFSHEAARASLADAEKRGATEGVDELFARQQSARADWVGWGQAALASGIAAAGVGMVAAAGGATWGLTEGGAE
ncbi:MAG: hypothetical protein IT383_06735 [Deltaproteobacteria bacterium]|nr:hypothetical protein [Deltaproteobacteria bacterium]